MTNMLYKIYYYFSIGIVKILYRFTYVRLPWQTSINLKKGFNSQLGVNS